jgi:hypothetical protein
LYRVPGDNVTLAAISGTTRVLVTQGARIVLVDLASPQDREGLPVLAATDAGAAVRTLASAPAEPRAIALLEGGSTVLIETEPLGVTPGSPAIAIAWPGEKAGPPPAVAAAAAVPAAAATTSAPSPAPPEPEPVAAAPPPDEIQDSVETGPDPATSPPPEAAIPVVPPVVTPPVAAPPASPPQMENQNLPEGVSGRISGPARADAREIVFLGPDNVLKEAARVAIDASGGYVVTGLKPGNYRVVAAGEGGRVLACHPAFVTVVVDGSPRQVPTLEVLRAY